jgi:hypothetical protein
MYHVAVVVLPEDEVVVAPVQEVATMVVVGAVVTSSTSHGTDSRCANYVEEQAMQSSSAIKGLTQTTWEKKRTQM